MSGVQLKAVQDLQAQLTKVMEELDHKVFRPQQRLPSSAASSAPSRTPGEMLRVPG